MPHSKRIAEFLRFVEHVRGEHNRSPFSRLFPDCLKRRALVKRIHAGRGFIQEHDRRIDHEYFGYLHAALESAAQINSLFMLMLAQAEELAHAISSTFNFRPRETVEAPERPEVVSDGEIELHGVFLNDHADGLPDLQRM